MRLFLGSIGNRKPLAYAEAAIQSAYELSPRTQAKFALTCGPDRRLFVRRFNCNNRINMDEWIATFTAKSDPDWLAGEIANAQWGEAA